MSPIKAVVVDQRDFNASLEKKPSQMSFRYVHTLLDKMQQIFPGYADFPEDRKHNYVLIAIEMFPAASRYEDFAIDSNGRFKPRQTLTNVRIEPNREDSSLVMWYHDGKKVEVPFHFWHQMRHVTARNPMYPLLTCDEGYLLAVEDVILFE